MLKTIAVLEDCDRVLKEQLSNGIIEVVEHGYTPYPVISPPHQAVVKPDKTRTKVRIDNDASATALKREIILNYCLLEDPLLSLDLV